MFKNSIGLIVIVVAFILLSSGSGCLINRFYTRAKTAEHNLSIRESQWKDKEGRYITEIDQIQTNSKELRRIFKTDSSKLRTDYEKQIYSLKKDLESLGVRYKDLLSKTGSVLVVKDTFITRFIKKDTTLVANHNDGYLNEKFVLNRDFSMNVDYTYSDSLSVMEIRKPKLKENGKKHWPNCGWLPWVGWDVKTLWYSNNPKARYSGVYMIKVEK